MRIVFMGTPDFAVGSLESLINAGHEIVGVFTQPDKPQGRKMVLTAPPVKAFAESVGLNVYQPTSVRTDEAYQLLKSLSPELIAVVAYGKIIPENILNLPKFGCVNVHASLLPKFRGASPIQTAILVGDKVTGVTTQLMDIGVDTGDILLSAETEILPEDNFETLHDKLAIMGAKLLVDTVKGLEDNTIIPHKQPEDGVSHASIITKEMGQIDFNNVADKIDCQIRAFTPWPSAYFFVDDLRIKVIKAVVSDASSEVPGTVIDTKSGLKIACGDNSSILITEIQPQGKGAMSVKAFLNGNPINEGTRL